MARHSPLHASAATAARLLTLIAVAVIGARPVTAARVRQLGLAEMAARADRLFLGRCIDRNVSSHPSLGIELTTYTFAVTDPIKGVAHGRVTVRIPGSPESPYLEGLPVFRKGEEALLFLYPESEAGFSSSLGLDQGRFRILTDKAGRRRAINARGNERLLQDVPAEILEAHGLSRRGGDGAVDLEKLVGATRSLVARGRP